MQITFRQEAGRRSAFDSVLGHRAQLFTSRVIRGRRMSVSTMDDDLRTRVKEIRHGTVGALEKRNKE